MAADELTDRDESVILEELVETGHGIPDGEIYYHCKQLPLSHGFFTSHFGQQPFTFLPQSNLSTRAVKLKQSISPTIQPNLTPKDG